MKHIVKTAPPREYADWCKAMKGQPNEDYRELKNPEKGIAHGALINDQGAVCAYTLKRIDENTSHIEHIKPETLCREDERGSDLEYNNFVACYPKIGMKSGYRYGAQEKDNWWEDDGVLFVSPLNARCEQVFDFDLKGNISSSNGDEDAIKTIEVLKLDHNTLIEDRNRAIQEFIYGKEGKSPLSKSKANKAVIEVMERDVSGKFAEFCVPIKSALGKHIQFLDKLAQRRKYAAQQKKKKK